MTRKDTITPLQAARQYATEHPEFEGEIRVTVLRPKGRGGWTRQTRLLWARDGRAAARRELGGANGRCRACGRVSLEPLAEGYGPDARAGQPLSAQDRTFSRVGWRQNPVYAAVCGLRDVCADCLAAHGLTAGPRPSYDYPDDGPQPVICEPGGFAVAAVAPLPVVEIDLTGDER